MIGINRRVVGVVAVIGATQTLAWASSYYIPAILAGAIAVGTGVSKSLVFGYFSAALLLSAFLGPAIGRAIDRRGGRGVLVASNGVLAAGLVWLALAHGAVGLGGAWLVLGIGMALGLYDPAFATLTALYGRNARAPITGITLVAGFASTVGWPLSALMAAHFGWRGACLGWAGVNVFVCLPLNRLLIPLPSAAPVEAATSAPAEPAPPAGGMLILAFVFGAVGFVTGAMAAHLPGLLQLVGASRTAAIAAASLMGPAQVAARLLEFGVLKRLHPVTSTRIALLMHPIAAGVVGLFGAPAAAAFALLHGAGNGLLTVSRGTLPLALFGPTGYGLRTGIIIAPARVTTAAAPVIFGVLMSWMGAGALMVSAAVGLAGFAALALLRVRSAAASARAEI